MPRLISLIALAILSCSGCSSEPRKNPDPVDVTGTVTYKGKPLTDVVLNLQPTGGGHPVAATVLDGKFKSLVTPGKYCYFITEGSSPAGLKNVPNEYREATLDLRDEIIVASETSTIDIELD